MSSVSFNWQEDENLGIGIIEKSIPTVFLRVRKLEQKVDCSQVEHTTREGVPKIENAAVCGGPRIHLVKGKVNAG